MSSSIITVEELHHGLVQRSGSRGCDLPPQPSYPRLFDPLLFMPCVRVLRCESRGWYPRPQLSWTLEGLHLPAGTMNITQDPSGLYTISSTVEVVELSLGHHYTCRVQTRETEKTLTGLAEGCDP